MCNKTFDEGTAYYSCSVASDRQSPSGVLVVSTWVYLGFVKHKSTMSACDVPYYFYRFSEYESYRRSNCDSSQTRITTNIPSQRQAREEMLDAGELLETLKCFAADQKITESATAKFDQCSFCDNRSEDVGYLKFDSEMYVICKSCFSTIVSCLARNSGER